MCTKCDVIENIVVNYRGYAYMCNCGHYRGWDREDFEDWKTKYITQHRRDDERCHYCKRISVFDRKVPFNLIEVGFILIGAL